MPLTKDQERWCKSKARRYQGGIARFRDLLKDGEVKCALSEVPVLFDSDSGTAKEGRGVHACYATIDHISPGTENEGLQVVCYALNDLKGHLPYDCFIALKDTEAWDELMEQWREQAKKEPLDSKAFYKILQSDSEPSKLSQ